MHFEGFPQKHNAFQRPVQHFPQKHNGFELLPHTLDHITKIGRRLASRSPIVSYESRGRTVAHGSALVLHWPGRGLPSTSLLLWCCTAALHAQCQQIRSAQLDKKLNFTSLGDQLQLSPHVLESRLCLVQGADCVAN